VNVGHERMMVVGTNVRRLTHWSPHAPTIHRSRKLSEKLLKLASKAFHVASLPNPAHGHLLFRRGKQYFVGGQKGKHCGPGCATITQVLPGAHSVLPPAQPKYASPPTKD